jgi:hypothetical protein
MLWWLPKGELGASQDGADLAFEVFDERYQASEYRPGIPFEAVVRLKYLRSVGIGSAKGAPKGSEGGLVASGSGPGAVTKDGRGKVLPPSTPPSIMTFRADPGSIEPGSHSFLRWAVDDATTVRIEPDIGLVPSQGERTVSPEQTTSYKMMAEGPGGADSSQVIVNVGAVPPPSIMTFQADTGSIRRGATTHLRWSVSGRATSVRIDPGSSELPVQGELEVSPDRTTQYTLTAEGPGGKASNQFTVSVAAPPGPSITFDAEPSSITRGQRVTLRWSVSGASCVSIEPGIGPANATGSAILMPLNATRYILTADGPGGVTTREITVSVTAPSSSSGELIWTGNVHGIQLITIDKDHADIGKLEGSLPGLPCILQPVDEKKVSIASSPGPRNNYERLVLRVTANGPMKVVVKWALQ